MGASFKRSAVGSPNPAQPKQHPPRELLSCFARPFCWASRQISHVQHRKNFENNGQKIIIIITSHF